MKPDPALERLAVMLVVNCFRNTVLENYHAEWPQFTDAKMKALMQEAVNRLYTALALLFSGDVREHCAAMELLNRNAPTGWDTPQLEQSFLRAVEITKQARKTVVKADLKPATRRTVRRGAAQAG